MGIGEGTGRGGARPGAGRPKGSKNKRTTALEERIVELGGDPIRTLVSLCGSDDDRTRLDAAKSLLPYLLPRLASQDLNISGETLANVILEIAKPDDGSGD